MDQNRKIEIYIRRSGESNLLNFYINGISRKEFIKCLNNDSLNGDNLIGNFEISVGAEWGLERNVNPEKDTSNNHIRIPIHSINFCFEDEGSHKLNDQS